MKSRFIQLHDNGRVVIVNVDEIRAVEPYEESEEELDEENDEEEDSDSEDEEDDEEDEEDEEEVEELEELEEESGYQSVISYKGIANEYTWVDETPEEIWDMLE